MVAFVDEGPQQMTVDRARDRRLAQSSGDDARVADRAGFPRDEPRGARTAQAMLPFLVTTKVRVMREGVITEADTRCQFVTPRLVEAAGVTPPNGIGKQRSVTNGKVLRGYQHIVIQRVIQAILGGRRRILATGTGTGKSGVAFQVCWKLRHSRWNRSGEYRRPKMLFGEI